MESRILRRDGTRQTHEATYAERGMWDIAAIQLLLMYFSSDTTALRVHNSSLDKQIHFVFASENCQFSFCRFFLTKNRQKPTKTSKTSQKLETWKRILISTETISKSECENR